MCEISVIIPVYNVEKYLKRCLDSVVNQTFKDIEIICINDGSTDSSLSILEEFALIDKRIKIINQTNQKLGAARNRGLEIAKGNYITYVDSDDWIDLEYLEKLYEAQIKTNADVAMSCVMKNRANKTSYYLLNNRKEKFLNNLIKPINELIVPPQWYVVWGKLYKKEVIENIKFIENAYFEDGDYLLLTCLNVKSIVKVPKISYHYFANNTSIIRGKISDKKRQDAINSCLRVYKIAKENNIKIKKQTLNKEKHGLLTIKKRIDSIDYYFCGIKVFSKKINYNANSNNNLEIYIQKKIKDDKVSIAFSLDKNYIKQLACAIISILENSKPETIYNFKILHKNLSFEEIEKIKSLACFSKNKDVSFEFIDIPKYNDQTNLNDYLNINENYNYISDTTYYRFYIAELFKDLNKILYLDIDILVKKDLNILFNKNIDNYCAGVVECQFIKKIIQKNKFFPQTNISAKDYLKTVLYKKTKKYFNAGVLLLNLDYIRKNKLNYKLWEFLKANKSNIKYQDQDVLNAVFDSKVKFLDTSYNKMASSSYKTNNITIVHFIGPSKPWNTYTHNSEEYYKFFKQTPFYSEKDEEFINKLKTNKNIKIKLFDFTIFNYSEYENYLLFCLFGLWIFKRIKN